MEIVKYIGLSLVSIFITQALTLVFFYIRYITDSMRISSVWVVLIPFLTSLITASIIFLIGNIVKLAKAKQLAIVIFLFWFIALGFVSWLLPSLSK